MFSPMLTVLSRDYNRDTIIPIQLLVRGGTSQGVGFRAK